MEFLFIHERAAMIKHLWAYYWHLLSFGKSQKTQEAILPYGRHELKKNEMWYGMTALALVGGLAIYSALLSLYFSSNKNEFNKEYECLLYPLEIPPHLSPPPKGKFSFGTIQLMDLRIPVPAPKPQLVEEGILQDQYILDPQEIKKDNLGPFLPPTIDTLTKVFWVYELPAYFETSFLNLEGEEFCFCSQGELETFEKKLGIVNDEASTDWRIPVHEYPKPINLKALKKLLSYPGFCLTEKVEVKIKIDEWGYYSSHSFQNNPHPLLVDELEKHIHKIRFTPAIQGGRPIPFEVILPIHFRVMD
ncbi:MAG: hypothetical protein AAF696_05865 [Bacteroidota bacterium]